MIVTAGKTSVSVYAYFVDDDSGTSPGEPTTGLLFSDIETGGSASYVRQGAARTDLTLITLASASTAYDEGGFILVDDTNMPGLYRVDFPDAAFATGVDQVIIQLVAASGKNTVMRPLLVDLTDVDLRDSTRGGMTALPNAAADGGGGLPISDAGGLDLDGRLDAAITSRLAPTVAARTLDITATGAAGIDWANVENPTTAVDLSATDLQLCDTVTTLTNLPAITANWLTAAGINAGALDGKGDWSLASVVGALNDAAVGGDPTASDTVMQYIKQLVNVLVGTAGVVTFPAAAAPGNAVSLAEIIRSIYNDTNELQTDDIPGTLGSPAGADISADILIIDNFVDGLESTIGAAGAGLTDITGRLPAALTKGTADSGTTTTMVDATRTEADTDYWAGSWIRFTSGTISGETRLITGFTPASDTTTFAPAATQAVGTNTYEILPAGTTGVDWGAVIRATTAVDLAGTDIQLCDTVTTTTTATNLTNAATAGDLTAVMKASVNAEVDTALVTTTYAEPAQGAPAATASIKDKIGYLYKAWRNRSNQTSTTYQLFNDDASTVDHKATVSDDATTAEKSEVASGP